MTNLPKNDIIKSLKQVRIKNNGGDTWVIIAKQVKACDA